MAGVIAYVIVDVVLQFPPPHYSVVRDAENNLAVGPYGWIMNLNFLGRAATTACVVLGIRWVGHPERRRTAGLSLLAAGGAASAVLAFFPTDVAAGVLPGRAGQAPYRVDTRRAVIGCVVLAAVGLRALGLSLTVTPGILGLAERICLAGILGWTFVVCAGIRRLPESLGSNHD
jgi:hypothetical membrane protein